MKNESFAGFFKPLAKEILILLPLPATAFLKWLCRCLPRALALMRRSWVSRLAGP